MVNGGYRKKGWKVAVSMVVERCGCCSGFSLSIGPCRLAVTQSGARWRCAGVVVKLLLQEPEDRAYPYRFAVQLEPGEVFPSNSYVYELGSQLSDGQPKQIFPCEIVKLRRF